MRLAVVGSARTRWENYSTPPDPLAFIRARGKGGWELGNWNEAKGRVKGDGKGKGRGEGDGGKGEEGKGCPEFRTRSWQP